jgi:hypothetical protein
VLSSEAGRGIIFRCIGARRYLTPIFFGFSSVSACWSRWPNYFAFLQSDQTDFDGNDRSLGCLNEKLKRKVDEVNPTLNVPPIDAKSQGLKTGVDLKSVSRKRRIRPANFRSKKRR